MSWMLSYGNQTLQHLYYLFIMQNPMSMNCKKSTLMNLKKQYWFSWFSRQKKSGRPAKRGNTQENSTINCNHTFYTYHIFTKSQGNEQSFIWKTIQARQVFFKLQQITQASTTGYNYVIHVINVSSFKNSTSGLFWNIAERCRQT